MGSEGRGAASDGTTPEAHPELAVGRRALVEEIENPEAAPASPGKRTQVELLQAKAASGVASAAAQLPHEDEIQRLFGRHRIQGTRAAVGGPAADAADALDAHAYTHGDRVGFTATPDLRASAHEAAHVVQQREGRAPADGLDTPGDELEQHADAVADRVAAGESAEPLLDSLQGGATPTEAIQRDSKTKGKGPVGPTNPEYVNKWGTKIAIAIMDRIEAKGLPQPHPRLSWVSARRGAEELALAIAHYIDAVPAQKLKQMMKLSYPADLFQLVDQARRGPEGTRQRAVEIAVASAFDEPLLAAIARMGTRAVVQLDQHRGERLRGSQIVASCPLDGVIADLLVRSDLLRHTPKQAGGADDTPGKPFAKGARDVKFKWLGEKDRKLWNWIEVTSPANATAEDVAQTSLAWNHEPEHAEQAYRIASSPPYFGIPLEIAKEIPQARSFAPDDMQMKLDTGPGPRVANPDALGTSTVSDGAAIAQAPARSKGNLAVEEALDRTHTQLAFLHDQLAPWHLDQPLAGAIAFVQRRRQELGGDRKQVERYATALSLQERVLHDAASELMQVLGEVTTAGATPQTLETVPPVKLLLKAFARAAGVSHLHAEAPAALAEARRQRTMLPLALAEERLRAANRSVAEQRNAEAGATKLEPNADKTPSDVTSQLQRAADLRLAAARGEQIDPDAVETLNVDASETELRARIVTLATYARALMTRADAVGLDEGDHPSGAWSVHHVCEAILHKVNGPASQKPTDKNDQSGGGWHEQLNDAARPAGTSKGMTAAQTQNAQRRAAVKRVSDQLARFSQDLDVNGFFKTAQGQIKDQEMWNLVAKIALQIGLTLVTGQVLGAAGAAIRGLALAGQIGAEIRTASLLYRGTMIVAEAVTNTGIQGAMGGKMGVRELAENALATVLTTAAMKPFHSLLGEGAGIEKAIRSWGQATKRGARLATELVIDTGAGIGAAGIAHAVTHGGEMTKHDAEAWVTQGLSIAASKFVQGRMIAMNHRITELAITFKSAKLEALNQQVLALRDRAAKKSDPHADTTHEEAIAILKERHELLIREHSIYEHDPKLKKAQQAADADLAATGAGFADMPLRLAHLSPLVDGHVYEGTASDIRAAFTTADATGVPMRREWLAERNVWRVKSGKRSIEIHERGGRKNPHESDIGAHQVPGAGFTGLRPKGEQKPVFKETEVAASTRDATEILNHGEQRDRNAHLVGDNRVLITAGSAQVTVRVVIGELMPQVAKHNYRPGANEATVVISREARPQDITRAVAHELAEIQLALEHPGALARPDALKKSSTGEQLSAHDEGRRAELKILLYELQNQPARKAEIQSEIQKLVEHLGFDMATVNGDMRARRIFGDQAIAGLDAMVGRERMWFKPEQVRAEPLPLKPGAKRWVLDFEVPVNGRMESLGHAECLLENGRPTSAPEFLLHKDTRIGGKNIRLSIGDPGSPISVTDLVIKKTIEKFKESFGHEPDTLKGSLADDNKLIFQRAYAAQIKNKADPETARQRAILETPFGSKRRDNGYDKFEIDPTGEVEILVGHPPQLVKVPANIEVTARKTK